ncbi:MAG: hypothetical protein RLY34_713 [Actinomycetota bacterium]|jgi:hypothetical protein
MVFKPNLRGIPASQITLSWCGWKLKNPEFKLLQFRFPWRRNWVAQLYSNELFDVAISRSGNAHLLSRRIVSIEKQEEPIRRFTPMVSIAFSIVFVLLAFAWPWVNSLEVDGSSTPKEIPTASATKDACEAVFKESKKHIVVFLIDPTASNFNIQFGPELTIGGVSSQIARITCGLNTEQFRVTKQKIAGSWQVTKSVQLNN